MSLQAQIRCRRGAFELEIELECGQEICAIVGPNGSGKTTLLDALSGELELLAGSIHLDATVLADVARGISLPARERATVRVYQEGRLFPHLNVRDNLHFAGAASPQLQVDELLRAVALRELLERHPAQLSAGERQRVALGRALLARPRALLLDEALSAVDRGLRAELLQELPRWRERLGVPMLYVSHAVEEIERIAGRTVLLGGRAQL